MITDSVASAEAMAKEFEKTKEGEKAMKDKQDEEERKKQEEEDKKRKEEEDKKKAEEEDEDDDEEVCSTNKYYSLSNGLDLFCFILEILW